MQVTTQSSDSQRSAPVLPQAHAHPAEHTHLLQFYKSDEHALILNVSSYLYEGLQRGEGVLVIAIQKHREAFARELALLDVDVDAAMREKRIVFTDSREMLGRYLVNGEPEWTLFENSVTPALQGVRTRDGRRRAYGDMVALLWESGHLPAAVRVEEFWNRLLSSGGFQLFCAYPLDVFDRQFGTPEAKMVLRAHTHLISSGNHSDIASAVGRATQEILGPQVKELRRSGKQRSDGPAMPEAEAKILWIREHHPDAADEILARARQYYPGEKRFRTLIENSSDALVLTNPEGLIFYSSPSALRIFGYTPEELIGRNSLELVHPEDREEARRMLQDILAVPRTPAQAELRIRQKDGAWRWIEATVSNLLHDAHVGAIVSNCRDITERKNALEALRASERRLAARERYLQAVLQTLPECVKVLGQRGEVLEMNPAGLDMLEADAPEDVLGKCVYPLIAETDRPVFQAINESVFQGGSGGSLQFSVTALKGSRRTFESKIVPLRDENDALIGALSATRDITVRKQTEQELRSMNEALRRANADLEQFAYIAAHDLKEPLRMVAIYSQKLQRQCQDTLDAYGGECLRHLVKGAQRMEMLVRDILAYTQAANMADKEAVELADANAAVEKALANLEGAVRSMNAAVTHDPLPAVQIQEVALVQVFQNLIENALKFRTLNSPRVHIAAHRAGAQWKFSVRDNGIGIAPKYVKQVFGIFKRLHGGSEYPGTGIGLAICQKIVERNGGRIWVESEGEGKGSTFCFTL